MTIKPGKFGPSTHRYMVGRAAKQGDLMLILAYMLKLNPNWKESTINIHSVVTTDNEAEQLNRVIKNSLKDARIEGKKKIITQNGTCGFTEILHEKSAGADIVFLALQHT